METHVPLPLTAKFRFDPPFMVEAHRRMMRQRRTYWVAQASRWIFLIGAIVTGIGGWMFAPPEFLLSVLPVFFLAAIFWFAPWLAEWNTWRNCQKSPFGNQLITVTLDEESYRVRSEREDSLLRWSLFEKVAHFNDGFLLMQGPLQGNWLPKSAFATPAEAQAAEDLFRRVIPTHFRVGS